MNHHRCIALTLSALILGGCAHPVATDSNTVVWEHARADLRPKINATVGLYIPPMSYSLELTSPAGIDTVRHQPYRHLETAYERMLQTMFERVARLPAPRNAAELAAAGIGYVVYPELITMSGSKSFVMGPPSHITVDVTSIVRDASGTLLTSQRVIGHGQADLRELVPDFGLAGQRAIEDAMEMTRHTLYETIYDGAVLTAANSARRAAVAAETSAPRLVQTRAQPEPQRALQDEVPGKRERAPDTL
jgi:hypothetical protein